MSRFARRSAMRQSFSYHRLRNDTVAERIVASTGLAPPVRVFEFGAGDGMLTRALASRASQITAIEIDRELHRLLAAATTRFPHVEAVHGDFREVALPERGNYAVVANLPFSLTSEAMRHLLERGNPPASAFLIVQREAAATWTGDGRTTLRAVLASVGFVFDVPLALRRRDFDPWPRVESVLLALRKREQPLLTGRAARDFRAFAARGFLGGSTVAHNLGQTDGTRSLIAALRAINIDVGAGPSSLSPAQWFDLWNRLRC